MNFPPPKWITDAGDEALKSLLPNHYSHPKGRIRLRNAIKNFYQSSFNRELDVETEILVTSGANQGSASLAHTNQSYSRLCLQDSTQFSPRSLSMGTR